jgi:chromosome segregation ATPase
MGGEQIVNMPGIAQLGPWVLVAIFMLPKVLEWIQQWRGKDLDAKVTIKTADVQAEIAQINGRFDQQKHLVDVLIARCEKQMNEIESLLERISTLNGTVMERDAIIREQANTITNMQRELDELRKELDTVKRHVKAIETDRDKLKKACPVAAVEESKE